jgi:phosphatidylglycerophosphatase C
MGNDAAVHRSAPSPATDRSVVRADRRPIVAFDFDGTLTVRDSFTAFLRWRRGPVAYAAGWPRLAPALGRYLRDRDRGRLKAAAVRVYLLGLPRPELEREARRFADRVSAFFRPDALVAWERHGAAGDRRVIVTASPEETVRPFAEALGADDLLGTRLAFDAQDRVAGSFVGENCRGEEKVRRLRERFGASVRLAAAYGDTGGDLQMLEIADRPGWRVFRQRP